MARKTKNKPTPIIIAIVGEGITEWHYFNDLKQTEKYKFQVKPELPKHSDVEAIVKKAIELREKGFDKIFCLFDMDRILLDQTENAKYLKFRQKLHNKKPKNKGKIIFYNTMPCIEYWFLLHFTQYSAKIYQNYTSLKPTLLKFLQGYDKSDKYFKRTKIYQTLKKDGNLELAIENATKLLEEIKNNDNELFPYTEIHILLNELKKQNV